MKNKEFLVEMDFEERGNCVGEDLSKIRSLEDLGMEET